MSLRDRTAFGVMWTLADRFGSYVVQFVTSIALARLLMPSEFGIVAMIGVVINFCQTMIDSGFSISLIRRKEVSESEFSTVFWFNLILSVIFYFTIFLCAPLIAKFYNQIELTDITRVAGLSLIIGALGNVQAVRLTKQMKFKAQAVIQTVCTVVAGITGVLLALNGFGVWSLVWIQLSLATIGTSMIWIYSKWVPLPVFSRSILKEHFRFGLNVTIANLINSIFEDIYNIIIGKKFLPEQLGFYSRANSLKQLTVMNISASVNKVALPMFSEFEHDDKRLRLAYKGLLQQVTFWIFPLLTGLALVAEPLFRMVFTSKWLPAVPYFQLLCIVGILHPLHYYNLNVLQVKGRSDLFLRIEIIKKSLLAIGIIFAIPYGIFGLIYFQILFSFFAISINSFYSGRLIGYPIMSQLNDIKLVALNTLIIGCVCYWVGILVYELLDWVRISVVGITGSMLYFGLSALFKVEPLSVFRSVFLSKFLK